MVNKFYFKSKKKIASPNAANLKAIFQFQLQKKNSKLYKVVLHICMYTYYIFILVINSFLNWSLGRGH